MKKILLFSVIAFNYLNAFAQYVQLDNKLVGSGTIGNVQQGSSVSLSADGKTALIGGNGDNSGVGAAWIYTFNGNGFIQLGNKMVGTGGSSTPLQGSAVSLSSDGKTALVGGPYDNGGKGAIWIYTYDGSNFVQAGNKLIGTDEIGTAHLGTSVSLSADGKTALVGGELDSTSQGAAWIYTFNGSNYVQYGSKLVGTGVIGNASQGRSVSLSADGKTAVVGGYADNTDQGAVWVFTCDGSNYVQVGSKLVGAGVIGNALQGSSVSVSGDGKTILIGGPNDNKGSNNLRIGAAWIFTFNGSNYVQAGNKLVGTGGVPDTQQGISVSLSSDGKTAVVGGFADNNNLGAVWVYTFNGSSFIQVGNKLVGASSIGDYASQGTSVSVSSDGKTILSGGYGDNSAMGATWVFTYTGQTLTSIKDFQETEIKTGLFDIYPNPSHGTFFIKSLQATEERSFYVEIYNSLGQYIGKFPQGEVSLPKGLYFLRHEGDSKKLIVN